jgi:hypothetical protein
MLFPFVVIHHNFAGDSEGTETIRPWGLLENILLSPSALAGTAQAMNGVAVGLKFVAGVL